MAIQAVSYAYQGRPGGFVRDPAAWSRIAGRGREMGCWKPTRDAERSEAPVKETNCEIMTFCWAEVGGGIVGIRAASGDRVCPVSCAV